MAYAAHMPHDRRSRRHCSSRSLRALSLAFALVVAPFALAAEPTTSPATTPAQAGLVDVHTLAPDIAMDIRYAGHDNFTGRPVPGYEAPKCYLLAPAAQALAQVQRDLQAKGYRLQVFDCYRPQRSVRAFVAWARDPQDQVAKARYYPKLEKSVLLGDYIAEHSGHSRGATVDLGLLDCRQGACRALDMGTGFDFFDPSAHTDTPAIDATQRAHRQQLLKAMAARGFVNYPMEWWHYTFQPEPSPGVAFDVPVR